MQLLLTVTLATLVLAALAVLVTALLPASMAARHAATARAAYASHLASYGTYRKLHTGKGATSASTTATYNLR